MAHFPERVLLSLNEAAAVAGTGSALLRDELEAGVVPRRSSEGTGLAFRPREVFYFRLLRDMPVQLSREQRRSLYRWIMGERLPRADVRFEGRAVFIRRHGEPSLEARIDATASLLEFVKKMRVYWHGRRRIHSRPEILGGDPVFRGTRVSVRHVGELVKQGVSREVLRRDFPRLKDEDFEFAEIYAELNRPRGRPRKPLELRR